MGNSRMLPYQTQYRFFERSPFSDKFFTKILLIHQFQGQKKTVAEEETASRETGLRIRLLTAYKEDPATAAAHVMNCEVLF